MDGVIQTASVGFTEGASVDDTPPARTDAIVLGAGVVGVATAYVLARDGARVLLVDEQEGPGRGASFANGAQLSYAYSDALASPALLRRMPALALGLDPAFTLSPRFDPDLIRWLLAFVAACAARANADATLRTLELALESQKAMHALLGRHALDFAHAVSGKLHLYFDRESYKSAEDVFRLKRSAGAVQHLLSPTQAATCEPAVSQTRGLYGAIYSPQDAAGDPAAFCAALTRVLRLEYNVSTLFGARAVDARVDASGVRVRFANGGFADSKLLVVALGVGASAFLRKLGVRAPIVPMKGYSLTAPAGTDAPRVSLTDTARRIVFCNLSGRMRVAGVAHLAAHDARIDPARFAAFAQTARAALPGAAVWDQATPWAGLRPMTPNSLPIIARPRPRLLVNIGHGMLGWTLAMGSAERLAAYARAALADAAR